jgi:hypothetical protein
MCYTEDAPKQQSGETFQGHAFEHTWKLYYYSRKDTKQHNTHHIHEYRNSSIFM